MEAYIRALEKEIAKRRQVVELLTQGKKYYDSLQGEAEIVATVRKEFSVQSYVFTCVASASANRRSTIFVCSSGSVKVQKNAKTIKQAPKNICLIDWP